MSDDDERRREARAPIELKVEYKRLNTFFYDYTKNISKGGTFIKTEKPLDIGTIFLFKLQVPSREAPFALRGEVRWGRGPFPPGGGGPWGNQGGSPPPRRPPRRSRAGDGDPLCLREE